MEPTKYGITWADEDDTLFQTGYIYDTVAAAEADGRRVLDAGTPNIVLAGDNGITAVIDELVTGGMERKPLYAYIETADDTVKRIAVAA